MSQIVRCEICSGVFNERYLASHKRMSHGNSRTVALPRQSEPETLEVIVSVFAQLSDEGKKTLRDRLAIVAQGAH